MVTEQSTENRLFKDALVQMFRKASRESCAKFGDLSQFMYASKDPNDADDFVNGGEGFNELLQHPDYYLLNKGKDLIASKRHAISDALGENASHICDLGPGPRISVEAKTIPFIRAKIRAAEGKEGVSGVVLVDRNREYITQGQDAIHTQYQSMHVNHVNNTFANLGNSLAYLDNVTYLLLGNTGGNFKHMSDVPNPLVQDFFESIRRLAETTGGMVVIEQDCTQDKDKLLAAYNNDAASSWMKNLMHRMVRDAGVVFQQQDENRKVVKPAEGSKGGLDKDVSGFEYFARWNEKTFCMEMGVKAKHDYIVRMNGDTFDIKAGTELHMWNSHKYPVELFKQMLGDAGFNVDTVITDADPSANRPAQSALHFAHVQRFAA